MARTDIVTKYGRYSAHGEKYLEFVLCELVGVLDPIIVSVQGRRLEHLYVFEIPLTDQRIASTANSIADVDPDSVVWSSGPCLICHTAVIIAIARKSSSGSGSMIDRFCYKISL